MTDIALLWNDEAFAADAALSAGALRTDEGLRTAILISLFTDARAGEDDVLPDLGGDRRGWWGDAFPASAGDETGSRLWLLFREKITPGVIARARDYVRKALAWLIEDGIARSIEVSVEAQDQHRLAIGIVLTRPDGPARERHDFVWEASAP